MATDTVAVPVEAAMAGLNSPPDSNPALKDTGSDSDLSDLDPDMDDQDILMSTELPAPQVADASGPAPKKKPALLKIEPIEIQGGVPIFAPTMEEFSDFTIFMDSINHYGMRSGIVKVIPPKEWLDAQPQLDEAVKTINIRDPISQDFQKGATPGEYRQINMDHKKSYNLVQWRNFCDQRSAPMPRGQRSQALDKAKSDSAKRERNRGGKKSKADASGKNDLGSPARPLTPMSPPAESTEHETKAEEHVRPAGRMGGGRQPKSESEAVSVSARRKHGHRATGKVDEAAFVGFDYRFDCSEFTDDRCEQLEVQYWRSLMNAPPLYGADMMGSLFDERTKTWNLGKLDNILDVIGETIPGVNTAYLYLGSWKATFAWHLEDVDLYSINYLHFGAPKQWYSISQDDVPAFEAAMRRAFPESAKSCDQFLRHKTFLISPARLLAASGVKVNKVVHRPGEFVITFPYGYHSGYNLGYNCAEAVNFALESWLEKGMEAKKCDCAEKQDPVWIDVRTIKKALGHEVEPSELEFTDDEGLYDSDDIPTDLPTPPQSSGDIQIKPAQKKRKRVTGDKSEGGRRIRLKMSLKEHPCVLCPNGHPLEPLLATERGEKVHLICAKYIPGPEIELGETEVVTGIKNIDKDRFTKLKCGYCKVNFGACFQCSSKRCTRAYHATCAAAAGVLVEEGWVPVFAEDGTEYKRWHTELSCRFHRPKNSKTFDPQEYEVERFVPAAEYELDRSIPTAPNFTKSYNAQVNRDVRLLPVMQSFKKGYSDRVNNDERLLKVAENLKKGDVCQVQYQDGYIWAGVVIENLKDESSAVLLDVLPHGGDTREVPYSWLLLPDPTQPRFQQASKDAKELPKLFGSSSSDSSNRQADEPKPDTPFVDGYTWSEFSRHSPRNPHQVKVDFAKKDQLWYYLGKSSTEAKAQFTEDLAKPRNNPASRYLDTLEKPVAATSRPSYPATYPAAAGPSALRYSTSATISNRPLNFSATTKVEKQYEYKPRPDKTNQSMTHQMNHLQRTPVPYFYGTDPQFLSGPRPSNSNWQLSQQNSSLQSRNPFTSNGSASAGNPLQGFDAGWVAPSARVETPRMPDSQALSQLLENKDLEYRLTGSKPPEDVETKFGQPGSNKTNPSAAKARTISLTGPPMGTRPDMRDSSRSKPRQSPSLKPIPTEDQATPSAAIPSAKGCRKCHNGTNRCPPHKRFCKKHASCQELDRWREDGGPTHDLCDLCLFTKEAKHRAELPAAKAKNAGNSASANVDHSLTSLTYPQPNNGFTQSDRGPGHAISTPNQSTNNSDRSQPSTDFSQHHLESSQQGTSISQYSHHQSSTTSSHSQVGAESSQPRQGFNENPSYYPQSTSSYHGYGSVYSRPVPGNSAYPIPDDSRSAPVYHSHSIPTTGLTQYPSSVSPSPVDGKINRGKSNPNSNFGASNKPVPSGTKYNYPTPAKSSSLGLTQSWKYKYLQLEHNKGSSDYKSPYRPGPEFGFMNGYQGSVLSGAILKELSKFLSLPQLEEAKRMSQSKAHELLISLPQTQKQPQSLNPADNTTIHQEHSAAVHSQSVPNPRQSNSSVLVPPSLSGGLYPAPEQDYRVPTPTSTRPSTSSTLSHSAGSVSTTKSLQTSKLPAIQQQSAHVSVANSSPRLTTFSTTATTPSKADQSIKSDSELLITPNAPIATFEDFQRAQALQLQSQQASQTQNPDTSQSPKIADPQPFQESPVSNMQPYTSSLIEGILGKLKKVQ